MLGNRPLEERIYHNIELPAGKERGDGISMHKKIWILAKHCMEMGLCVVNGATSWRRGHSASKPRRIRLYYMTIVMGMTKAKEVELYYVSNDELMTS